jgi:flagellar hook-associated protein 1 FlgK
MATVGTAFNIAQGALDADQAALDIVANNTANVNTPGYTREVPIWRQNDSVSFNGLSFGTGVSMTGPQSQRSRVLEQALQQQTQAQSATSARLDALNQIQALFSGATGTGTGSSATNGIGTDLSNFFQTFASLEASPADDALRQSVLSAAGTLASDFNGAANQLASQKQSLDVESSSLVQRANALLQNIAQLNLQIESQSPSADAGSMEDQRQQDLTTLSQLIGIRTVNTENNGLTVTTMDGALLVSQGQAFQMTSGMSGGVTHYFDSQGNDITTDLTAGGGELGGVLTARDQDISQVETALDQLAYGVATAVNTQNAAGSDLNGNAGGVIFTRADGSPISSAANLAGQIAVGMTDPAGIAASASGAGSASNANAVAMAALENAGIVQGISPTAAFSNLVTSLGSRTTEVSSENTAQQAGLTQLQNQIGALSGVNLNDEAASLETLEQSYQAASKLFTVLTQVMAAALNLGVETTYS